MNRDKRFDSYISNHFSHVYGKDIKNTYTKRYYLWKSYLEKFLPVDKKTSILEIGCGMGHNLFSLKRLGYKDVLGFDLSQECVDYCNGNGLKSVYAVSENDFVRKMGTKKFSLIIFYDVIEHYIPTEAEKILSIFKKILAKNGMVLISVPNAASPLSVNTFYTDITHRFMYNEHSMEQLLHTSGMKSVRYVYSNSFTLYDENVVIQFIKRLIFIPISFIGEIFWRFIALSQGVIAGNLKPAIYCFAVKLK